MDYKKLADVIKLCGSTPKVDQCRECPYWAGGDMSQCIPRMTADAATAITALLARAEAAEARAEKAEIVDAVPVVRCRECKHYKEHRTKKYGNLICRCARMGKYDMDYPVKADDFCSYGEKAN